MEIRFYMFIIKNARVLALDHHIMAIDREQLKALVAQRDELEAKIRELNAVLAANNVGMSEPLIDADGFPRADIDVVAVRSARHDIICLNNDLKELVLEIEKGLQTMHGNQKSLNGGDNNAMDVVGASGTSAGDVSAPRRTSNKPFAVFREVADGGPAATAGICDGDELIQLHEICFDNFTGDLKQLGARVQAALNSELKVTVLRDGHAVHVTLVPRHWKGQGTLGCRLMPL